jgi:hypothetical protein
MLWLKDVSSHGNRRLVWSRQLITKPFRQGEIMPDDGKTLGQTYHEEVEALKVNGLSNADAIRELAKKYDKNENAIRGGIHQYRSKQSGGTSNRRGRRRSAQSVDGLLADAREALEQALSMIDSEVEEAKSELDAAQVRYDTVQANVADRKADIEKKLKALA